MADAQATVAAARDLAARGTALLGRAEELRARASHQLDALKADEVHRRLQAMPVSALKEAACGGVRWAAIEQAGLRSVADVQNTRRLVGVPGVGERSAEQVTRAAWAAAIAVRAETRFRFDPDRATRAQAELLATLAALRAAEEAEALRPHLGRLPKAWSRAASAEAAR
ncbi:MULTISPECIES: hypothetical protein [unclassified Pseudonocardia]|uniref:hypothetical protein n=1 Tax=unclassified Pseudonocardia TaxID=2619320 RepID=UPI0001FFE0C2|nr:hypothetical protein [Pseudonocardia sp. Ae707_Ps1]OLM19415.1 Superfamily II DNA/RNA helicase, SNF2 family [Pseudonocardia sp. Ae707_Ps1]